MDGTKVDINKFTNFLVSLQGGAWKSDEIITVTDPDKNNLLIGLKKLREADFDFVIVMFSGHGGYRQETILEINQNEETINITNLLNLGKRQLSIFDCCRVMEEQHLQKSILSDSRLKEFSMRKDISQIIRKKYEERILNAITQQNILFSCSVGECAYDSKLGAIYVNKLTEVATRGTDKEFMTVGQAHQKAAQLTIAETSCPPISRSYDYVGPQNPDAFLPKCLTSQQLIISINPFLF